MPAIDKLQVLNSALIRTSNTPLNVSDNGSDEWTVASQAYDDALPYLLEARDWNFQTAIIDLQRIGPITTAVPTGDFSTDFSNDFLVGGGGPDIPAFPGYSDVFAKPTDSLHLQNVWRTDIAALFLPLPYYGGGAARDMIRAPAQSYRIVGNAIHTTAPNGATAIYVQQPSGSLTRYSESFVECLRLHVMAGIFLGLNEDEQAAAVTLKAAREALDEAAARAAQEEPRRTAFRSAFLERRRRSGYRGWP